MERNTSHLPTFPTPVSWPLSQADHETDSGHGADHGDRWAWWTVGVLEGAFSRVARVMGQAVPKRAVPLEVLGRMYEHRQLELLAETAEPANATSAVARKVGGDVGVMAIGFTTRCASVVATAARTGTGRRGERRRQAATERRFAALARDSGDVVDEVLGALRGSTG